MKFLKEIPWKDGALFVTLGKCPETTFRKYIVYMTIARLIGTILAQLLFLPGAQLLAWTETHI